MSDLERLAPPPSFEPIYQNVQLGRIIIRASLSDVAQEPTPSHPHFWREAQYGVEDRTGHTRRAGDLTVLPTPKYDADIKAWRIRRPEGRFGTYAVTSSVRSRTASAAISVPSLLSDEHFEAIQKFAYRNNGERAEDGTPLGETILHIADDSDAARLLDLRWKYPATTLLDPQNHVERAAQEIIAAAVGLIIIDENM